MNIGLGNKTNFSLICWAYILTNNVFKFLYGSMNNNNIVEDFIINIQNSVNAISYKDYENKVISFLNFQN